MKSQKFRNLKTEKRVFKVNEIRFFLKQKRQ